MAKKTGSPGRPTKLTPAVQRAIVADVEKGVRPEVAASCHGVQRSTFFEWLERGKTEPSTSRHALFRTAVTRAWDRFEAKSTKRILKGDKGMGFGPAKAALEVLSRRMPRQWAQQVKHHVETVEDEFFDALEQVCADSDVLARVCETKDLRLVFVALCEALARRESEGEAPGDSLGAGGPATGVHTH